MYGMPTEIDVQADGALRIITLNRPDALNAVNDPLHCGLAGSGTSSARIRVPRAAVLTGAGRAFSAGGDFNYLDEIRRDDAICGPRRSKHGRDLVIGMIRCRIRWSPPSTDRPSGWAAAWPLSDIVYMAETPISPTRTSPSGWWPPTTVRWCGPCR